MGNPPSIEVSDVIVEDYTVLINGTAADPDNDIIALGGEVVETGDSVSCIWLCSTFQCYWESPANGNYAVVLEAEDATALVASAIATAAIGATPICVDRRATNDEHVNAGRAEIIYRYWADRYYAIGSSDYLGRDGNEMVDLAETSPGFFEEGTCP